jgi:PadR family transcriptional regulator PadR
MPPRNGISLLSSESPNVERTLTIQATGIFPDNGHPEAIPLQAPQNAAVTLVVQSPLRGSVPQTRAVSTDLLDPLLATSGLATTRSEGARPERCFPGRGSLPEFERFVFLLLTEDSECMLYSVTEDIKHMSKPSDLVQGTLDMLLLKILALEPMNGFAVSQRLKQVSGDVLQVSDGSLYPALHKLEQEGRITAEWKTSEYGRRAKYYSLTRLGRRQLEKEADNWGRLSSAISRVIRLKEA